MGLVDYNSRQPNQKAKITNKYDEDFALAIITRIRAAIAAIYIDPTSKNCQSHHFNIVNHTHSTRASIAQQTNQSKLPAALNLRINQLLLSLCERSTNPAFRKFRYEYLKCITINSTNTCDQQSNLSVYTQFGGRFHPFSQRGRGPSITKHGTLKGGGL